MAFKVEDRFRKHELSFVPGGVTVFIKRTNGQIREYDKVKWPYRFIYKAKKEDPEVLYGWIKK